MTSNFLYVALVYCLRSPLKKTKFKDYADVKHTYENDLTETYRNNKDLGTRTASFEKSTNKVFCVVENASLDDCQSFLKRVFHRLVEIKFTRRKIILH